jgi:hypothetical protein
LGIALKRVPSASAFVLACGGFLLLAIADFSDLTIARLFEFAVVENENAGAGFRNARGTVARFVAIAGFVAIARTFLFGFSIMGTFFLSVAVTRAFLPCLTVADAFFSGLAIPQTFLPDFSITRSLIPPFAISDPSPLHSTIACAFSPGLSVSRTSFLASTVARLRLSAFSIRFGEQPIDKLSGRIRRRVALEGRDFLGRRQAAGEVQRKASDQCRAIHVGSGLGGSPGIGVARLSTGGSDREGEK